MSQQWKGFKQGYYRNFNNESLCRAGLLSGNGLSEHVATVEMVQQRYYWKLNILRKCRPELLSGNVESENVAACEGFKQRYYGNITI